MKHYIVFDDEVVIFAKCQQDGCEADVRSVTMSSFDGEVIADCGHVQRAPERLVWVVRDSEPDCGA